MPVFRKGPAATLDFSLDWTDWLSSGQSIGSSNWTASSGLTVQSQSVSGATATVVVSGGTAGKLETLVNSVTSSPGNLVATRTIHIVVEDT